MMKTTEPHNNKKEEIARGDWLSLDQNTPIEYIDTVYFANSAKLMAEMAAAIGKTDDAKTYQVLFQNIKNAFQKKYIDAGNPPQNIWWKIKAPPAAEGSFPVTLSTPGASPLKLNIVLGNRCPPAPAEVLADIESPIKSARVIYPPPETRRIFWTPLAWFGNNLWDAGWLLTYLLVYLPVMFFLRWIIGKQYVVKHCHVFMYINNQL